MSKVYEFDFDAPRTPSWVRTRKANPGNPSQGQTGPFPTVYEGGESDTVRRIKRVTPPSNLPRGASLSPRGDLGALRARETRAVFKGVSGNAPMASRAIPTKRGGR